MEEQSHGLCEDSSHLRHCEQMHFIETYAALKLGRSNLRDMEASSCHRIELGNASREDMRSSSASQYSAELREWRRSSEKPEIISRSTVIRIPFEHNEKSVAFALDQFEYDIQIFEIMRGETTRRTCRYSKDPPGSNLRLEITGSGLRLLRMMETLPAQSENMSNLSTSPCPSLRGW